METTAGTEERLRFTQGAVAVLVIAGFVFKFPWINPVVATAVGVALVLGPQADVLAWPFDRWLAPRVRNPQPESNPRTRIVIFTTVALLSLATLLWVAGLEGISELIGLVGAGIAALYATTGIVTATAFRPKTRPPRPSSGPHE